MRSYTSPITACKASAGLLSWVERSAEVERAQARVAVLTAERDRLDRRVMLLREESLDLDMLDEQARRLLNLGLPDERILFTAGGSPPSEG